VKVKCPGRKAISKELKLQLVRGFAPIQFKQEKGIGALLSVVFGISKLQKRYSENNE